MAAPKGKVAQESWQESTRILILRKTNKCMSIFSNEKAKLMCCEEKKSG